jgi:3D (Asp-Asp-Asp) domain-containing protein
MNLLQKFVEPMANHLSKDEVAAIQDATAADIRRRDVMSYRKKPITPVDSTLKIDSPIPVRTVVNQVMKESPQTFRVTNYVKTGNPMSNGDYPYVGAVATSDRNIPLGTMVKIDGKEYVVADRTEKDLNLKLDKNNKPLGHTFDIFTDGTRQDALNYGAQQKPVEFTGNILPNRGRKTK